MTLSFLAVVAMLAGEPAKGQFYGDATVEVHGLPKGCRTAYGANQGCCAGPPPRPPDE